MYLQQGKILFTFFIIAVCQTTFAQPWIYEYYSKLKSTEKPILTFQNRQIAFNTYWSNKDITSGSGYKQFRRWENFMAPRTNGISSIDNKALWESINQPAMYYNSDSLEWQFIGPDHTPFIMDTDLLSGNGRLNCIAFHPNDSNILYVGAPSGGMWMTSDGGKHWKTTTDKLSSIGISDIIVSHEDPNIIYLATGDRDGFNTYSAGIIKSTDGGETWNPTGFSVNIGTDTIRMNRILMHPKNADIMLVATTSGISRTIDGWETFSAPTLFNEKIIDMEFHPDDPNIVYASSISSVFGAAKIFRSVNGGKSFIEVSDQLNIHGKVGRIELATTEAGPNLVYAIASDRQNQKLYGIFKSQNSGKDWQVVNNSTQKNLLGYSLKGTDDLGQGFYDLAITASPTNKSTIVVGGINIWKSIDGGVNWKISSYHKHDQLANGIYYVHADHHMLAYSPHGDKKTLYSANDGGLYRSYDHGKTWEDISNNLQILQSYKLSSSQSSEYRILTGNQDNGSFLLSNSTWNEVLTGDGMECFIDPFNDNNLFYSIYHGRLYKSNDGGLSAKVITPNDFFGAWVTPYQLNPYNSNIIYAGYKDVYRSNDSGETWEQLSQNLSNEYLISLVVSPSNNQYIYTGSYKNLHRSNDGGQTWIDITNNLPPNINKSSIAVSPNDPNKIWVTLSGYVNNQKIYFSNNGGKDWENFSTGLPNVPFNHLAIRPNSNQEMYAASDIGVYYRNSDKDYWEYYSYNLPNVIISEVEISKPFNKLRAATFGRGIWELQLPPAKPSKAEFESNINIACTNAPIELYYTGESDFDNLVWQVNNGKIISASNNNDTIVVQYSEPGAKSIELTHYLNDSSTVEMKYQYLKVTNRILDFPIIPDKLYICDTSTIQIRLPEGYDYSFNPDNSLDSIGNSMYNFKPVEDASYALTVKHGTCEVIEEEYILFMPDDICKAMYLDYGTNGVFSNACATSSLEEPVPGVGTGSNKGCSSQNGWCEYEDSVNNSVWFKLVVPENGKLRVRVSGFDSQIALYKANSCKDLTLGGNYEILAANDDLGNNKETSEVGLLEKLTPGDTLYLQVDGSFGGVSGEFSIEVLDRTSGIDFPKQEKNLEYSIYPNPAKEEVNIQLKLGVISDTRIDLISLSGQIIESRNLYNVIEEAIEKIDTSHLSGIYLLRITIGQNSYYNKLIIY